MGLFDIPAPFYTALDDLFGFLSPFLRLLCWALLTASLSMLLYWLCSAQDKVAAAKARAISARNKMATYNGNEFAEMWPLAKESLAASCRHFIVVLGPAILSSLPALTLIVWVSNNFSYSLPEPKQSIRLWSKPANALADLPSAGDNQTGYTVVWPSAEASLPIRSVAGQTLVTLPLVAGVPVVHQRLWWNSLIGNPNGYLPADSKIQELRLDLPSRQYLPFGPNWIRGWEFSYFVLLILASLAIKLVFRIH